MRHSIPVDGEGVGDPLILTIVLWMIRIILPLAAAALWLKFSSPDEKSTTPSLSSLASGFFGSIWLTSHPSYTVTQILRYRKDNISHERPSNITTLAPPERRQLGRKTEEGEAQSHMYSAPASGLLSAPGMERDGPRPGTFRNGVRASLRRELNSPQADQWLPTADASQLGVTSHTSLMPPPSNDTIHGGQGMQMHGGGLISAAAYQKMKNTRRAQGGEDAPSYTNSPTPYTASPEPLSLTHALSAAFTNNTLSVPGLDSGAASKSMSSLRSLAPSLSKSQEPLFESPAIHASHARPHTAVAQGDSVGQIQKNSIHHVNTHSPPLAGGASDSVTPSFITANRDAVIELRKLLSAPNLEKARSVLDRLREQGMSIAPQTYTLLVTVAILCGCKDFATICAKDMSQAGYTLSDALQTKLQNMVEKTSEVTSNRTPEAGAIPVDLSKTKLMANAPVFTPSTIGALHQSHGDVSTTRSGSRNAFSASSTHPYHHHAPGTGFAAPPTAPTWLLSTPYPSGSSHDYSSSNGQYHHGMGGGARVVPIASKQQPGPLAWLPPQHGRSQQGPKDASPPLPDSSPPPSDMLPHRRPVGSSAPSSPHEKTVDSQRPTPMAGTGGAKHFQKAVSQLSGSSSVGKRGARRSLDVGVDLGVANRRTKSTWRKKTEET